VCLIHADLGALLTLFLYSREEFSPKSLEFRLEAFNVFNHAQFYGPSVVNGNISSANSGQVVSAAPPRLVQLAGGSFFRAKTVRHHGNSKALSQASSRQYWPNIRSRSH
jgi:hypothetical protein